MTSLPISESRFSRRILGIFSRLSNSLAPIKVPIIDWLPLYTREKFINDAIAGVTVFVLLIPQGMAYALVGGLPPVYGLYTASFPQFIYAMLATSMHISMGPMAITSLMLGQMIRDLGYSESSDEYISIAMNITMIMGILTYLIGTLKLGVVVNFLSSSVLSGFLTASACVISISQLKHILGIRMPKFTYSHQIIYYLATHLHETNTTALSIGITSWIVLYAIKVIRRKYKSVAASNYFLNLIYLGSNAASLFAIVISAIVAYVCIQNDEHSQLQILGVVPPGLRTPGFAFLDLKLLFRIIPGCLVLSIVSFTGNWAVAKKFAYVYDYDVSATQELIATGLTNIIGVFFNAFVISGGIARTAVNVESGARTQISGCIASICIILSLLFFTPYFYYIPLSILGAIINVAVSSLIDFDEMIKAYRIDRQDCAVMVSTCLVTFFIGISEGIFFGFILSTVFVMKATAYPNIVHLGKLPNEEGGHFKDTKRFNSARQISHISIVRMDAPLYYANCEYFKETVIAASRGNYHSSRNPIQMIILDVSAWIDIDLAGLNLLDEIHGELIASHIQLAFASAKGPLRDVLKRTKFVEKLGEQYMHMSIDDAVRSLYQRRSSLEMEQISSSKFYRGVAESRLSKISLSTLVNDSNKRESDILLGDEEKNPMLHGLGIENLNATGLAQ